MVVRMCAGSPLRRCASAPVGQCSSPPVRQCASAPVCRCASAPVGQWAIAPVQRCACACAPGPKSPPVTVSYRLSPDLVLSDGEPVVGWWDASNKRWRTDGVTDVRVENGVLTYSTVKLGHLSLLQSRHEYLPYTSWSVRPSASGDACVVTVVPSGNERFARFHRKISRAARPFFCA